jgi:broad specificity phosphatase PhoE
MARVFLVRHGEADSGYAQARDPGLSEKGRRQSDALAERLVDWPAMTIWTGPLLRARQTAQPLAVRWSRVPQVEPRVTEILAPDGDNLAGRGAWLNGFMTSHWRDAPEAQRAWRTGVLDALCGITEDTIVFTHFVAINVAAGAATGQDKVTCFMPENASLWGFEVSGGRLLLSMQGAQIAPRS